LVLYREFMWLSKRTFGPLLVMGLVSYFSYHMIQGNHGIRAWWKLDQQLAEAQHKLVSLTANQSTLENKVQLLNPSSLCPDMLEERSREVLGYVLPDELVILHR